MTLPRIPPGQVSGSPRSLHDGRAACLSIAPPNRMAHRIDGEAADQGRRQCRRARTARPWNAETNAVLELETDGWALQGSNDGRIQP